MIKVAIVEDQELMRESISHILSVHKDIKVVGMGCDGYDAIKIVDAHKPEVVLLDVEMPIIDGVEVIQTLKNRAPKTNIIMLSSYDDEGYIIRSIRNGAAGYLLKDSNLRYLPDAVRIVNNGGGILTPSIAKKTFSIVTALVKEKGSAIHFECNLPSDISRTELQIITCVGKGCSNKEIAQKLSLNDGTVRNYISAILDKTGLRDRTQIAIYAIKQGLVELDNIKM